MSTALAIAVLAKVGGEAWSHLCISQRGLEFLRVEQVFPTDAVETQVCPPGPKISM